MKIYGELQFQSDAGLPENPQEGQVAFDNATKQLYVTIYDQGSPPVLNWVPLTSGLSSFQYTQSTAASVWNITHNLGSLSPIVQVYDTNGDQFIPESIIVVDENNVQVNVGTAVAGKAMVVGGLSADSIIVGSP